MLMFVPSLGNEISGAPSGVVPVGVSRCSEVVRQLHGRRASPLSILPSACEWANVMHVEALWR